MYSPNLMRCLLMEEKRKRRRRKRNITVKMNMKRPIICLNSMKIFKVSIQIDNFIFPEYINMNFIVIGLSPHIMKQLMMKTFSMKIQIVTRKARKKRRNINVNVTKKKRNRNQVTKTRWRVRVSNTQRNVTRRKRSIRIGNLSYQK